MSALEQLQSLNNQDQYAQRLGIQVAALDGDELMLALPFLATNMNMGGRLHGGVIASVLVHAARLLVQAQLSKSVDQTVQLVDFQIAYLKGGEREAMTARAKLKKRTREFAFVQSEMINSAGEVLATTETLFRLYAPLAAEPALQYNVPAQVPIHSPEAMVGSRFQSIVNLFNRMIGQQFPGCQVTQMGEGSCQMTQQDLPHQYDFDGNISPGQILTFYDNLGGGSASSLGREFGMAVTLTIQASFCEPAAGEMLVGNGRVFRREQGMSHNEIQIYGAQSGRLKVFGTMTHLLRPPRK